MRPTASSLVLDLLSTMRRGAMPVRALVDAGALFGLEGNGVRVALVRLRARGVVERDERGLYRIGMAANAINERVASWRSLEARHRPWSGAFVGVTGAHATPANRAQGARSLRALRFLGFRTLAAGLDVRPDNLAGGVEATRTTLCGLGLDRATAVFRLSELDAHMDARARTLWDVRALQRACRSARIALERSEHRLTGLAANAARVESFLVGGRALRQLTLDPLLPSEICDDTERNALLDVMRRYDRAGRAVWASFLQVYGVLPSRGAQNVRMIDAAMTLAAAGGAA